MATPRLQRRITVDEYEQMIADGLLTPDDRVELIGGEIIPMAPMGVPHVNARYALTDLLMDFPFQGVTVSVQCPIRLGDSEPEPDIALVRRKRYRSSVPTPADVFLLIEVADSTVEDDRRKKLPRYAAGGVVEAWLVDVQGEVLERHTEPRPDGYSVVVVAQRGELLPSTVFPSLVFDVDTVLGPEGGE